MKNFEQRLQEIEQYKKITISGLNEGEKAFLPYFFDTKTLIICNNLDSLDIYKTTLQELGKKVISLESKLPLLITLNEKSSQEFKDYYNFISFLEKRNYDVILMTAEALFQKLPNADYIKKHTIHLKEGGKYNIDELISSLIDMGYTKRELVYEKGEFAVRGDILDVFPINEEKPFRINFFDDDIESINVFDKSTFKQEEEVGEIDVFCNSVINLDEQTKQEVESLIKNDLAKLSLKSESMIRISNIVSTQFEYLEQGLNSLSSVFFLPYLNYYNSSIFDYIPNETKIIFDEPKLITDKLITIDEENINSFLTLSLNGEFLPKHMDFYFKKKEIFKDIENFNLIAYSRLITQNKIFESEQYINFICPHIKKYTNHFVALVEDIKNLIDNNYTVVISNSIPLTSNKLKTFLNEKKLPFFEVDGLSNLIERQVNLVSQGFSYSAHFEMEKILFVGERELNSYQITRNVNNKVDSRPKFLPQVGEYVVHEVHGIGKCIAIKNLKITNVNKDYIIIEYRDGDLLYVPCENADMLSSFSGEQEPKCNKIGGTEFFKVKQKVKKSIKEMTFDLIKVYSDRLNAKGFVYSKDTYLQSAFEESFPYAYTEDQVKALNEIKADMESKKIMDRLLCGDVGFGKTEVALAAAFKAIQDGKQVAIICPTTILCEQHYATAVGRMKNFLVRVACINRFRTQKEQAKILQDLKEGNIDLICGTHRLLSNDVKFKDLGLMIIDEEQRFGVEDKDKLKNIKKNIDVLSLSATPIPRTLYMSLVGIRDVSFITNPPKRRKLVKTSVVDYSDNILIDACKKELDRGGQVLIVYNRVATISNFYAHVKNLLKDVKIDFAHGQMSSKALEEAIYKLYSRQTQILISTILIENGIDLPYANTLFVIDADKLGLSQLYQLRGRIGRSDIEAYAYFSFSKDKALSEDSYKRLDAIMEFSDFGSGYKVALRDLEIRGAGDVLGRFQHGHMQQVGFDMYVKLLNEAVGEIRGEKVEEQRDIKLDIGISAFVPNNYISSNENRIVFYTKVSKISSLEDLNNVISETSNIYGPLPQPVKQLCYVGLIKNLGQKVMASRIVLNEFGTKIYFYDNILNTPLYEFLSDGGIDFVLNKEKMPIITLKKEVSFEKQQESLINFLLKCLQIANK